MQTPSLRNPTSWTKIINKIHSWIELNWMTDCPCPRWTCAPSDTAAMSRRRRGFTHSCSHWSGQPRWPLKHTTECACSFSLPLTPFQHLSPPHLTMWAISFVVCAATDLWLQQCNNHCSRNYRCSAESTIADWAGKGEWKRSMDGGKRGENERIANMRALRMTDTIQIC